jgi:integrase
MASIRKRGASWQVLIAIKGVRESGTFDTKAKATAWAAMRETEIRAGAQTGVVAGKTLLDAFDRYVKEISSAKRGHRWEGIRIKAFERHPIAPLPLAKITHIHIAQWRDDRLKTVTGSTVNRELNLLSNVFAVAQRQWHWIAENPCTKVKRPKDSPPRDRRVSDDELTCLGLAAGWQEGEPVRLKSHEVYVSFLFAIETAMRAGEIAGLRWQDITGNVAHLPLTKNGTARNVPLSKRALELLAYLNHDSTKVFSFTSSQLDGLFRRMKQHAMIDDLHFHDSRHEAITRLAKKLNVLDLARMVGHKDIRQLQTYYNATAAEIANQLD